MTEFTEICGGEVVPLQMHAAIKLASQLMYTPLSSDDENLSDRTQAPMFTDEVMFKSFIHVKFIK